MGDPDQARQDGLIATAAVLTSLATALLLLRSFVRFCVIRKPGWDDGMVIVGTLFTIAYFIILLLLRSDRIGFPATTLTFDNMTNILKGTLAIEAIYYTIVFSIKTSIVFMYLRFAVSQTFRKLCYGTIAALSIFYVVCIAGTLGQCRPLEKAWDVTLKMPGTCINLTAFFYFTSGFNIITDFWILLLPIPTLRGIHIRQREKVALYCVFGIGGFATALSCVRLQSIYTYTLATDPFHDAILVNLWSMIEVNSALVCTNVPALKPLFTPRRLMESVRNGGSNRRSGYEYHGSERTGQKSGHSQSESTASGSLSPPARLITVNDRTVSTDTGNGNGTESTEIFGMNSFAAHDRV